MFLIFDTETTGLPNSYNAPISDSDNWPRMVQLAWQVHDKEGKLIEVKNYIIKPEGYEIPYDTVKIHGITTERAKAQGVDLIDVLKEFNESVSKCKFVVGHNVEFDNNIIGAEFYRKQILSPLEDIKSIDTMKLSTDFCAIVGRGKSFKYPKLQQLHKKLFDTNFEEAHNAAADVEATTRCFLELIRISVIGITTIDFSSEELKHFKEINPKPIQSIGLNTQPYSKEKTAENSIDNNDENNTVANFLDSQIPFKDDELPPFTHLHVHTQYSILDGMTKVKLIADKAKKDGQTAVAITDHGNMYGVKDFHNSLTKNGIKPILGMEAYVALNSRHDKNPANKGSYHLVLLAKNKAGYKNLIRLSSLAFSEGFYHKPKIDWELLEKYNENIIATSACLGGEIAKKLTTSTYEEAEKTAQRFKKLFNDDFYIELQRHKATDPSMNTDTIKDQNFVNKQLIEIAINNNIKIIATNDVHYLNAEDASAHDRLVCLNMGKDIDDPYRLRYTGQEWMKTRQEMKETFGDIPDAIRNTQEINDKIELFELNHKPIMPDFALPEPFTNEDDYLRHITYEGAKMRWGDDLKEETIERLDFELETIKKMGFPGYFLIVWDFLKAAREMGVSIGPGRGSAAGSAAAYCLRITDIDPIKYNLLFERFLNPDRVSMPDIDIDFDDLGREKVLHWVKEKYGAKRVAHLITFGSMAAKSSIKDVSRVQKLPLSEANRLAKLIPEKPGTNLTKAFAQVPELKEELENGTDEIRSVLNYSRKLEGSVRSTGTHACGIIISKDDMDNYVPMANVKGGVLDYATQFDGHFIEDIGLLKMDFLGLKTLTVIKDALANIKLSKGIDVDIENVPLTDKSTYELYSRGDTSGLFQFESDGMRKHLRNLKPTKFEDLIAMNALYRPGPMEYIDSFIDRKHGKEAIHYDLPVMEEYLSETYGITVYQEQVMLLSRKLGGFSRGDSDSLRKAMGKKIISMMDELKVKFLEGCEKNGHDLNIVEKIWKDWEAFAKYAFNKSHATCYSYISFQTAFLKAHHPAEFMASVLSHELKELTKLTTYLNECNRMGIKVLGPQLNESYSDFTVNSEGQIRYGMAGIKGVGGAAVQSIIEEREANGNFVDIFDFLSRINLRAVNKKAIEALAMAGAFDELHPDTHRAQFFAPYDENNSFIERLVKHGNSVQAAANSAQASLFGDMEEVQIQNPEFPICDKWSKIKQLNLEKDLIGFYLSGHPLDTYKTTVKYFVNNNTDEINERIVIKKNGPVNFAGVVTREIIRESQHNGNKYGFFSVEDKQGTLEFALFKENFLKYHHLLQMNNFVYIQGVIKDSYRDKTMSEFDVSDISMLANVLPERTNKINIRIFLKSITSDFNKEFISKVKEHPGSCSLHIYIQNAETIIEMAPKGFKVDPQEFLRYLENHKSLKFKIGK
ncbi:MAG: DNA polymerase III subunit alpha [Bacteroidales bacterium]|nr:DNA polymerase III subunit alpha [Bacteroidales bacterium]